MAKGLSRMKGQPSRPVLRGLVRGNTHRLPGGNLMLGFQGGVSIPLVKGGVKAPPAKRQCRAGPKAGARRGFTWLQVLYISLTT